MHTSAGRHEKWCICKRVTIPNAVYIFSAVQYKKPPKTTLHLYYSGEYCKDFNGKQMYRVPYCSVALSYSLHCCLMLPPHLSVCERDTSMCMHHWINSICIPMFGVQEKDATAFTSLARRLNHQLTQRKLLMGCWNMNYSSGLGCLVFLCRHMFYCPTWLRDNSWAVPQSYLLWDTISVPTQSSIISPTPQY